MTMGTPSPTGTVIHEDPTTRGDTTMHEDSHPWGHQHPQGHQDVGTRGTGTWGWGHGANTGPWWHRSDMGGGPQGRRKDRDCGDTARGGGDHQGRGSDMDGVTTCVTRPQPLPMSPSPPSVSLSLLHLSAAPWGWGHPASCDSHVPKVKGPFSDVPRTSWSPGHPVSSRLHPPCPKSIPTSPVLVSPTSPGPQPFLDVPNLSPLMSPTP